ncbi:hypothetical protein [Clostridium sp.]|uniref:hypothetical protein n=1 Tax=Clostridium sp. TaxID=1506 RepID=UPI0025B8496A|nr:hypothetical protein [Clostridium sp.]
MKKEFEDNKFKNDEILFEDIEEHVEYILEKSLKEKQGFFRFLSLVKNDLGFKNIFIDKSELIFIGLIFIITIIFFGLNFNKSIDGDSEFIYKFKAYNFIVAPIVYFIICSYSFINSKLNKTYEIQATCKYNFYNITAIRMFVFSIVSILINVTIISILFLTKKNFRLIDTLIISATALFIFSVLYILVLIYLKKEVYKYIAIILWLLISVIIFSNINNYWGKFFLEMPIYIHLFITIVFILVYIKNLTKLMNVKKGEI